MLFCCVLIFFEASTVQRVWTINSSYDECSAILAEVANPLSKLGYTRCCRVPGAKKSLRFEPGRCQFWAWHCNYNTTGVYGDNSLMGL